jgi:HK97 gp10 family phage protein
MNAKVTVTFNPAADKILGNEVEKLIDTLGAGVLRRARRVAPVKSGDLRRSLRKVTHRDSATKATSEIGSDLDYSPLVERGTSKMAAQPYLRPALYQTTGGGA